MTTAIAVPLERVRTRGVRSAMIVVVVLALVAVSFLAGRHSARSAGLIRPASSTPSSVVDICQYGRAC